MRGVPPWNSLRVRLPLFVSALVALVLAVFLWFVHGTLEEVVTRAGGARARAAAAQVIQLLSRGITRTSAELHRAADNRAVLEYLRRPDPTREEAAQRALVSLAARGQPPVELWDRHGRLVLLAGPPGAPLDLERARAERSAPAASGVGEFYLDDGRVMYEVVEEVSGDEGTGSAEGERLGWLVLRRQIVDTGSAHAVSQLVGVGATVAVGNRSNTIWTNLREPVTPPTVDVTASGPAEYTDSNGTPWIGAIEQVPSTPWAVWVGLPRATLFEPGRELFRRMVVLALVVVLVAAVAIAVVSARVTGPLAELVRAAEALAGGDLDRRVALQRRDEIGQLARTFNTMARRLADAQRTLEARVAARTRSLQRANEELEAFTYSVSHDLRAPLRHVVGFAALLKESAAPLGDKEKRYLDTIVSAASRMGMLIDDLLALSRVGRTAVNYGPVDLNQIVLEARRELAGESPAAEGAVWRVDPLPVVQGDRALLRLALINLLSNALKYSSTRTPPEIHVGATRGEGETVVFVRDNGVGFDMQYAHKLFGVFQRLHRQEDFEGTGIGLANVRRIIERHGGRSWAEGAVDGGATFYFSLPDHPSDAGGSDAGT